MKKVIILILILTLVFSMTSITYAKDDAENIKIIEAKVEKIIEEINIVISKGIEIEELGLSTAAYDKEFEKLEDKLLKLGAKKLKKNDLEEMFNIDADSPEPGIQVLMADPPDYDSTDNTQIYGLGPSTTGGFTYYTVYATSLNSNSVLYETGDDQTVSTSYDISAFLVDTLKIYAYKAIGTIPIIQWLPYEYFDLIDDASGDPDNTFNGMETNWTTNINMKHMFIYDSGIDYWHYRGAAQKVYFTAQFTAQYFNVYGASIPDYASCSKTLYSEYYSSFATRCNNSSTFQSDKVSSVKFTFNGATKDNVYPPFVSSFSSYN